MASLPYTIGTKFYQTIENKWTGKRDFSGETGILEIFKEGDTSATKYPPKPGTLIIHFLKKDGTPGKYIQVWSNSSPYSWKLPKTV